MKLNDDDGSDTANDIDKILQDWRQGDCVIGEGYWILFRINPESPLTGAARNAISDDDSSEAAEEEVMGFMVATQSCDIVRCCMERPFIEVCPLVEVDDIKLDEIHRNLRVNYAYIPGVADRKLVADLDRIMTVEKAVLLNWTRIRGCFSDTECRTLSIALARKRSRFAFPDDFNQFVRKLKDRLKGKHSRDSEEGISLRSLREIRVKAEPSWKADRLDLIFYFIKGEEAPSESGETNWDQHLKFWLNLVRPSGRVENIDGVVQTLDDLTARDYVESNRLDLDHLSSS